jgi:membrane protein DedA with SNARE-associated domain
MLVILELIFAVAIVPTIQADTLTTLEQQEQSQIQNYALVAVIGLAIILVALLWSWRKSRKQPILN